MRDTDYAAVAITAAITEKFGHKTDISGLRTLAKDKTILLEDGARAIEGTRDQLLAGIRKAVTYDEVWQALPAPAASTTR